eukprot:15330926-Ditylum_brightwellii.AAC.1
MISKQYDCAAGSIGNNLYAIRGKNDKNNKLSLGKVFNKLKRQWLVPLFMSTEHSGCDAVT